MKFFKIIIGFSIYLLVKISFAQSVTYNHIVDANDSETKKVMMIFEAYIASNPENQKKSDYWNLEDQKKFKNYDYLESEFQPSLYMGFPVHVLSISVKDEVYKIKAQLGYTKENGEPYILAIVNYILKKKDGEYKLYNALDFNKKKWSQTQVGYINYYYPKYHKFDYVKASKLNDFISAICTNFMVEPQEFEYYFANDFEEVQKLKGLDYYIGMGGASTPSGQAAEGKIYCGGIGEYYPHEVFHIQIEEHYPNKHYWTSEGIATFLGGSRGRDLQWHLKRTHDHLKNNPEIDLTKLLDLNNLDQYTSYHYSLGGLIAKKVFDKNSWSGLKELMTSGPLDTDYYNAIEKLLGIKRVDLNTYLRDQLKIETQE